MAEQAEVLAGDEMQRLLDVAVALLSLLPVEQRWNVLRQAAEESACVF